MYTVVFKQKYKNLIVFDVFKKTLFGQKLVGNVFCTKDKDGKYHSNTTIYLASKPQIKWDGGRTSYFVERTALWICYVMIEERYPEKDELTFC